MRMLPCIARPADPNDSEETNAKWQLLCHPLLTCRPRWGSSVDRACVVLHTTNQCEMQREGSLTTVAFKYEISVAVMLEMNFAAELYKAFSVLQTAIVEFTCIVTLHTSIIWHSLSPTVSESLTLRSYGQYQHGRLSLSTVGDKCAKDNFGGLY